MDEFTPSIALWTPSTPQDWGQARVLLAEYGASLAVDLSFQSFDQELLDLPSRYLAPGEVFLLASVDEAMAGCCALTALTGVDEVNACEMRRLYVRPAFRGFGLGRAMVEALMQHAREAGFRSMLLDTLSDMEAARQLYASLGFEPTDPYYYNPLPGAHYFRVDLDSVVSRY